MSTQRQMPRYKSHKEVHALKIKEVIVHAHPNTSFDDSEFEKSEDFEGGHLMPEDEKFAPIPVDADWFRKHSPRGPGYYVVYQDGYKSWSPVEAFESGYSPAD